MTLAPTWDLFILVLFIVVTTFSFIVRASGTSKLIISTYVSMLAADGLGNLFFQHLAGPDPTLRLFNLSTSPYTIVTIKILCFVAIILFMMLKGSFESGLGEESGGVVGLSLTAVLGFLNAGLVVSVLLVYLSGGSFLSGVGYAANDISVTMYQSSQAARIMVDYANLWFSFPAIGFIVGSMMTQE